MCSLHQPVMLLLPSNAAATGEDQLLLHLVTTGDSTLGLERKPRKSLSYLAIARAF